MKDIQFIDSNMFTPKDSWDLLSMAEKSEMMKVAVRNGIYNLNDIREKYNEFAEGGNLFGGGGYRPSASVKKRISTWEGAAMTGAIDPLSGKWGKNRSFEAEADSFYNALPSSIREQVLSNPELADNLFSYSYNVGAGNFRKRVVPALEKYYTGNGSPEEIANSMWATGDKKLRGLRNRRAVEKKGVVDALTPAFVPEPADNTFMPNPFAIQMENTYQRPVIVPDEDRYVTVHEVSPSEQRAESIKNRFDAINRFNVLMDLINPQNNTVPKFMPTTGNSFLDALGLFANSNVTRKHSLGGPLVDMAMNEFANGVDIYIKPENLFPIGGLMPINFPLAIRGAKKTAKDVVRKRLYNNVYPFGYNNPAERLYSAIVLNKPSEKQEYVGNRQILDDLWGTYLGIPDNQRHYNRVLQESEYQPTIAKNKNTKYYKLPYSPEEQEIIIREGLFGNDKLLNPELGTFTIGSGHDSKGHYISYYDPWNLNPFTGITNVGNKATEFLGLDRVEDLSMGIGKPIEIYDRIYLDDYYGVKGKDRGGHYLPEITVFANPPKEDDWREEENTKGNYANGGGIHIKPYILEGKRYYKNGGVLEGNFDVDDLSREEIEELNKLGYIVEIL